MKTKAACPRLFEVEASRDGRLGDVELARFQAHLAACAACAREARALQGLTEALRSSPGSAHADELHVRRERTRLLAAFDASLVPEPRSARAKLWLGVVALAALGVFALFLVLRPPRAMPFVSPLARAGDAVDVRPQLDAKWSRLVEGQSDTVTLESGTLSIHVDHAQTPLRHLLVILPDGELEDIGTTFSVTAAAAQTTNVTVRDGRVILRLHGKPALALSAGDSWQPAPPPLPSATPVTPAPAPKAAKPPLSTPALTPSASAPDPAADFHDAVSAFNGGDNGRAVKLLTAFLAHHPRDAHAEDAAYLRVLSLQRAGDANGMKRAANAYLTQYPGGFRRAEVEPLSR